MNHLLCPGLHEKAAQRAAKVLPGSLSPDALFLLLFNLWRDVTITLILLVLRY